MVLEERPDHFACLYHGIGIVAPAPTPLAARPGVPEALQRVQDNLGTAIAVGPLVDGERCVFDLPEMSGTPVMPDPEVHGIR